MFNITDVKYYFIRSTTKYNEVLMVNNNKNPF